MMPDDRPEALLAHDRASWWSTSTSSCGARYGVPAGCAGTRCSSISCAGTGVDRRAHLLAHRIGGRGAHQRSERGLGIERIAEPVLTGQLDRARDEGLVELACT